MKRADPGTIGRDGPPSWHAVRLLRAGSAPGLRRRGGGLSGEGRAAGTPGGDQGPAAGVRVQPRAARPVRAGSPDRVGPQPPERHHDLRHRKGGRDALHRHGARRGEDAPRAARARLPARAPASPLCHPDRGSAGQGPRRGHRAPGPQAREPHGHDRRPGEDPRLRPREADDGGLTRHDRRPERPRPPPASCWARCSTCPRSRPQPVGGPPLGPVHAGDDPVRDGQRPAGLSPRLHPRDARRHHVRGARAGGRPEPGRPRGPAARHRDLPPEGSAEALRDHERPRPRALGPAGRAGGLRERGRHASPGPGSPGPAAGVGRGSALRGHEPAEGPGVLLRRHGGGADQRPHPDRGPAGRVADLVLPVQGQDGRRAHDRPAPGRQRPSSREASAPPGSGCGSGPG